MDTQSVDAAYHAGWEAGEKGHPRRGNPYRSRSGQKVQGATILASSWDFGYTLATQNDGDAYYGRYEIRRK